MFLIRVLVLRVLRSRIEQSLSRHLIARHIGGFKLFVILFRRRTRPPGGLDSVSLCWALKLLKGQWGSNTVIIYSMSCVVAIVHYYVAEGSINLLRGHDCQKGKDL